MAATTHAEVAERIGEFMEAVGLTRDELADALDGAISPRSLYAILAGDRRPSRAVAVLVERTFGCRADWLLDGSPPIWTSPTTATPTELTEDEAAMVAFARRSADNARLLRTELDRAELWERLYDRTRRQLAELSARRDAGDERYPDAVIAVLDDAVRSAEHFGTYTSRAYDHRVADLVARFLRVFLPRWAGAPPVRRRANARVARLAAERDQLRSDLEARLDATSPLARVDHPRSRADLVEDLAARLG